MKKYLPHIGMVVLFIAMAAFYFAPAVFHGKVLQQGDTEKYKGMVQELVEYNQETDRGSTWTGSMFSGMPSYNITAPFGPKDYLYTIGSRVLMFLGSQHAGIIFLALLSTYLMLIAVGCDKWIALFGAVAYAFSSYFLIIIAAGHITKSWAMAFFPFVIVGLYYLFKGKWLYGAIIFTAALVLELESNHIQVTYYFMILCLFIGAGFVAKKIKNGNVKEMLVTAGVILACGGVAMLVNSARLYSDSEMSHTSLRGPSRLTSAVDGKTDKSSGLDQEYAFAWSYGMGETLTVLVPNLYGGESGGVLDRDNSNLAKAMKKNGYQVPQGKNEFRSYTYWGDQPFTSGPVYFGAIVCFLFVLGMWISDSKYKWWLLAAALFLVVLSWGRNFPAVNDFLFHNMPLYNKFRTPSMALVGPQFIFAVVACMALKTLADGTAIQERLRNGFAFALIMTAGVCLLLWLVPGLFLDFTATSDAQINLPEWYKTALVADREDMASRDAFRSLVFILLAAAVLWFCAKPNMQKHMGYATLAVAVLTLVDLWNVDRRYLDDDNYMAKVEYQPFKQTVADRHILNDKDLSFRVLTLNNPFNDTHVSYFHKSIGGYSAAKLRDYQDLIDKYIEPEMVATGARLSQVRTEADIDSMFAHTPVLNMLNMRYMIYNDQVPPLLNKSALGNAWFVKEVKTVATADDEMTTLGKINPRNTAVVGEDFKAMVEGKTLCSDTSAIVVLQSYAPDELKYVAKTSSGGLALFSEVYYPQGWTATIDGQPAEIFRANWILRGLDIPAGEHVVEFKCYPETYWTLRRVGSALSVLLLFALVALPCYRLYKEKKAGGM